MAESFFATLKEEMIYRRAWPTRHELEMEVFSFIEGFYNPLRRHSRWATCPAAYEQQLTTQVCDTGTPRRITRAVTPPGSGAA